MEVSPFLKRLVDANAPLWAAEAEVFRTYWDSPVRSSATDQLWLFRQMFKELINGFERAMSRLDAPHWALESREGRDKMQAESLVAHQELIHFCLLADVYERLQVSGSHILSTSEIRAHGDWPENQKLMELRARHRRLYGSIGRRAHHFTEGGFCTLHAEGMTLRGRGGIDDLIADACGRIYNDEFEHMLRGVMETESERLVADEWETLTQLTVEQLRLRIHMRNAQFSFPLSKERVQDLCDGQCAPIPFPFEQAAAICKADHRARATMHA